MIISALLAIIPSQAGQSVTGRVLEILAESGGKRAVVVLDVFQILSNRHPLFGMPMLARRNEEAVYVVIPSTVSGQSLLLLLCSEWNDVSGHRVHLQCAARLPACKMHSIGQTAIDTRASRIWFIHILYQTQSDPTFCHQHPCIS